MQKIQRIDTARPNWQQRKKVAAYARVSVATDELLNSLANQIGYYSDHIRQNPEWEYAGIYADEGITGTSIKKRAQFRQMIRDAEAGKIDIILTKSISRFARDTVDCLNTVRHLKELGVEVRFERENISTMTSDGELFLTLLASFAQAESESIAENVKWTTRKNFQKGEPNGHRRLFGYKWDGEKYQTIKEEAEIVKWMNSRYLDGVSGHQITKELKERGVVGITGKPMALSTVVNIITSIAYTGTMVLQKTYTDSNHKRKPNEGELPAYHIYEMYEPIISREDYERANEIRQKRAAELANGTHHANPLSGKVKCGHCGFSMQRRSAGNKKIWACNIRERKGNDACWMPPIKEAELISACDGNYSFDAVYVYGDRLEFRFPFGKQRTVKRKYGGKGTRSVFYGKVYSRYCGHACRRVSWGKAKDGQTKKESVWKCEKCKEGFYRLPEQELIESARKILKARDYEGRFIEYIEKVIVDNENIEFIYRNGDVKKCKRK